MSLATLDINPNGGKGICMGIGVTIVEGIILTKSFISTQRPA